MEESNENPLERHFREQALAKAGQRRISLIWEISQALIAFTVVMTNMMSVIAIMFWGIKANDVPSSARDAMVIIIMFYFQRTHHNGTSGTNEARKGRVK